MMIKTGFSVFLLLIQAAYCYSQSYRNEFGFRSENDSYLGQGSDRYYTNGLFLYYRHAGNPEKLNENVEKKVFEITAGQRIYNPFSGYAPDPAKHDRPFAGYLYAGAALHWLYAAESSLKASVEVGTIGPNSLGEDGQDLLHRTIGFYRLSGWDYQISNEATVNLAARYTRLLHRAANQHTDFLLDGYVNAGTLRNDAAAAIVFRAGRINQLFNSGYNDAVVGESGTTKLTNRELYFYAKPQLNYVVFDATVQGGIFNNDSPVVFDVEPLVFTQQLGFSYNSPRFTFDFSVFFKTKEIESTAKAHQYGAVSASYRFN
ncbi:lipid A deacylase LpxR family protein [Pedobacter faecalis]|uniref:lipid A deacylase LpxR family protein n=1 Tax=Pedobacter faecalis TaxID=3041495 RepID=UPI00254C6020|nr:lipid A deacylase LpxR family protein [Pedobacter sp. ELA7]